MTSHPQDARTWQRPDDPARPTSASLVDPEDDLPSSTYGGDFETTAIPRYDADKGAPAPPPVFNLMNDPEPLPYVQPHSGPPVMPYGAEPSEIGHDFTGEQVKAARRRGTQDLGLMLLRVGLGVLLVGHGLQKAFGWWGGPGLGGFQESLAEVGYEHANILTYVGAIAQIGAGLLLVLGLFTPVAAAVALAYLINALLAGVAGQSEAGFPFFLPDGFEFQVTLIVVAAALVLTGPGRYGFDAGRGWARRPFVGSFVALLLGIGLGVAMWILLNGANPLA